MKHPSFVVELAMAAIMFLVAVVLGLLLEYNWRER